MGTWSSLPFGNDTAKDWAWGLEKSDGAELLTQTIQTALKQEKVVDAPEAEKAVAAAAVIASAAADPVRGVSADIKAWIHTQAYVPTKQLIADAIRVLDRVTEESELRELWEEADGLDGWLKSINKVRDRLLAAKQSQLPDRKPRKPGMPRALHKLLERYEAEPSEELRERIRKKIEAVKEPDNGTADTKYREPLALAARYGLLDEVRILLTKGANPSGGTAVLSGAAPFVEACARGHLEVAEVLRQAGAEIFDEVEQDVEDGLLGQVIADQMDVYGIPQKPVGYRYCLALFSAARHGPPAAANYLVGLGADLRQSDLNGETLLHKAAAGNNVPMLRFLLEAGLDVNSRKGTHADTVLHYAVQNGSVESVTFLLENGADPNAIEKFEGSEHRWYNTPLDIINKNKKEISAVLKKYGGKKAKQVMAEK